MSKGTMTEAQYLEHARKGHPFDKRCEICMRSYMSKRPSKRRAADDVHDGGTKGAVMGIDTVDGLPVGLRQNTDVLIGTESTSNWGGVYCTVVPRLLESGVLSLWYERSKVECPK